MNLKSAIESILFLQGEPLEISRLTKITGAGKKEVAAALLELAEEYRERGIQLIHNGEEWQLATNPEHKALVERFLQSDFEGELSRAGLEVLAVVAYKGPISRANIEYVRGVNSSFTLRNLLIRGLVLREENPEDRRSYLYRISGDFLKVLGVRSLSDLPHYREFQKEEVTAAPPEGV
ncbi:MAG: SMC-Scp complex subunit ScpB [Candidatus Sungbacteria bacterium]|uniref:SMC-Scp complex subunit ScpB n=1 Tax=Candidatus Sungiibacteriota bacterium TaxID=2750080 RepID=A0A932YYH6_9BACT|nr:SMC-Scp complex subunit ScpB [Candidatus Sungbacteria bacterium]